MSGLFIYLEKRKQLFNSKQIADYYDQTEVHYKYFWDLDESHALHYGIWLPDTQTFKESLNNTNEELAKRANISKDDLVLDAGCGVGGSALFLARKYTCKVSGISLSAKQIATAQQKAEQAGFSGLLNFEVKNYCETGYPDASFDVVWALESVGSATDKKAFVKEAARILKPGGRLVLADYFKTSNYAIEEQPLMKNWLNGWAISDLETADDFKAHLSAFDFQTIDFQDFTKEIKRSSKRMYQASFLGFLGTKAYNLFKNASPFSRIHYKSGIAQYKALKQGLWEYALFSAKKV